LKPDSVDALGGMIRTDLALKRPAAARSRVDAALAKSPQSVPLLMLGGLMLTTVGDMPQAEAIYRRAIAVDPSNLDAYMRLGGILKQQQRLDEAKNEYAAAADRSPDAVGARTMVGIILTLQGKHAEARKQYEDVMARHPKAVVAANNLAWYYAEEGRDLDTALKLAQAAKAGLPNNPETSDTLGWVYYKKGLASLAVASFKESSEQTPANPIVLYHLGLAYLKNGNNQEAKQALQRALKLDPSFEGAEDAKRALSSIQG
jgi:Tfp pilus assembly protein PilF